MTSKILALFNGLNKLCEETDTFFFSEQETIVNGNTYIVRSFSYRLASWTEFKLPFAKDARGTAFYTLKGTEDWNLFCRAYRKFHNLGEGSSIKDYIEINTPEIAYEKLDGSLILVGKIEDQILCKSKTSIISKEAAAAQKLIDENIVLKTHVSELFDKGYTSVFELVGPDNIIAIQYDTNHLVYLGIVNNEDYSVSTYEEDELGFVAVPKTFKFSWDDLFKIQKDSRPNIEGFVVKMTNGELVKVKVNSYLALHNVKDTVNNMTSLATLIINDHLDDLFPLFENDQETLDFIIAKNEEISPKYNKYIATIDKVKKEDFSLDKRDFAMKQQKENPKIFPILMALYLDKPTCISQFFIERKMF